jgi:hypothetical protein
MPTVDQTPLLPLDSMIYLTSATFWLLKGSRTTGKVQVVD